MIAEALAAYAQGTRHPDEQRASTLGASEVGQCLRKSWFTKHESDSDYNVQRDPGFVNTWGAQIRGSVFESGFWVPALCARFGESLKFAGRNQQTLEVGYLSATPDALIADVPSNILAPLGVPEMDADCFLAECKTIDPRAKLDGPKAEHRYQAIVQLGIVREIGNYAPTHYVISYVDASFWNNAVEYVVKFNPTVFEQAKKRAAKVMTATKPSELPPEGWIAGGAECRYCPFTMACGVERHAVPEHTIDFIDPQFVAEIRDLAREAKQHQGDADTSTTKLREIQHEIRERLRAKSLRRVEGDDFAVVWSPVKGRQSYDMKQLKAAAIAAGIDISEFETTGQPTDRLDIRVRGTPTEEQVP
jgi:hypothetical protein